MAFIQKRNIALCIVLSLVTCGIYLIYWDVKLAQEAVKVKDETDSGTTEILLLIFLPFLGIFLTEKKLYEGATARGIQINDNSVMYLVLGLFGLGLVGMGLMQNDLNKLADAYPAAGPAATGYYDASQNGFNAGAQQPYNNGGYNAGAQQPYNNGGYNAGAQQPYNNGGYDANAQQPYNNGGYNPNNNGQQF